MTKIKIPRVCKICKIMLNKENSYYPKATDLLCKKHYIEKNTPYYEKRKTTESGRASLNRASMKAYVNHKEKWVARAKARYAVSKGILLKPKKCEVCEKVLPLQGHHEDYTKPLEVIWLCVKCHVEADRLLELSK